MGVKSTTLLSRSDAEEKYKSLLDEYIEKVNPYNEIILSDNQLELELERLNDFINGGEGYENFGIIYD